MQTKQHWEQVYTTKPEDGVSWFQEHARQSIELISRTGVPKEASIIDVGGGVLRITTTDRATGATTTFEVSQ